MSSPACGFRNCLIALSICLCALLAFSTTLSADTATFVHGQDNLGTYLPNNGSGTPEGVTMSVGPYAGVLTDTYTNKTSPNYLFFCLTGNNGIQSSEPGTVNSVPNSTLASQTQLDEAAFLASYMLTEVAKDDMTLTSTDGVNITFSANGSTSTAQFISSVLGPIQDAIWYIMKTLPSGDNWTYPTAPNPTVLADIGDPAIFSFVILAQNNYKNYLYNNVQVFSANSTCNPNGDSLCGQNFISVDTLTPVPEPGTMVLFGAGVLLMGLGCARRRLAKRSH
jgi:hypothetical protein